MSVNSKSYPHPVLGNEDDAEGSFNVEFKYELSKEAVFLNTVFNLQNENIEKLIKQGMAAFIMEVECRSSFFRTSFSAKSKTERFSIPSRLLRERVSVSFYVCASENIKDYIPSGCHPDYEGARFEIEKGDVIAAGGNCSFIAEKSFDPLRPPISSLMSIREGSRHAGPMEIDYGPEKITVELSKDDWREYIEVKKQNLAVSTLHASIVLPVLIDAIYQVQKGNSEFEDKSWYGRLEAILDAKGLNGREPFEAAQRILDNPASRNFQSINEMLDVN